MREIKYKVWNTEKKKWLDHNELLDNAKVSATVRGKECKVYYEDSEICMSTGFEDRNGEEIYESYIVKIGETGAWVVVEDIKHMHALSEAVRRKIWVEVIGNIYENKELVSKLDKKEDGEAVGTNRVV